MGVILELLEALERAGIASPGDIVISTGKPRYLVLATLKVLEELGFIEAIYSRGTHRIYRVTSLGSVVLDIGVEGLREAIEKGLEALKAEAMQDASSGYSTNPQEAQVEAAQEA